MSRTATFGSNSVIYPDLRVFAFSPYKVEVTGTAINQAVTFTYNGFSLTRYTNTSNKVIIEISGLLQSFFAGVEFGYFATMSKLMQIDKDINVAIGTDNFDMNFDIIFGALQIGEVEPIEDTIYRFGSLPLTLTQTIGTYVAELDADFYGKDIDLSSTNEPKIRFYATEGGTLLKTTNIVLADVCPDRYYLRWFDKYGNYRYYNFKFGKKTEQTKLGTAYNYNVMSLDATSNLYKQPTQIISKPTGEVIIVSEPSADALKTAHIRSIFTSPKVWLYMGDSDWMEVTIAENDLTESYNEGAREINVSIIMPKKYIQEL